MRFWNVPGMIPAMLTELWWSSYHDTLFPPVTHTLLVFLVFSPGRVAQRCHVLFFRGDEGKPTTPLLRNEPKRHLRCESFRSSTAELCLNILFQNSMVITQLVVWGPSRVTSNHAITSPAAYGVVVDNFDEGSTRRWAVLKMGKFAFVVAPTFKGFLKSLILRVVRASRC